MRVQQVVQKPQRRGAEIFALQLSEELERRGHSSSILYLYSASAGSIAPRPQDRRLEGRPDRLAERLPGIQIPLLRRLVREIRDFRPDIVQVNGSRTVKYGSVARRLADREPWALIYRSIGAPGDWSRGLRRELYARLVISRMDGIVAVSQRTLTGLERCYRPSVPTTVIPRGIDPEALAPASDRLETRRRIGTPPNAFVLVYAGALTPEKRPDRLLRMAREVLGVMPEAELWILGDGPCRADSVRQAERAGLGERTRFLGEQPDVGTYLEAADLLVLTSDTEGTPGVVLEAGFLGLPVVATRVGGVGECVLDGATGLLAEASDEATLVAAVLRLARDGSERRRLGQAAREHVATRFSIGGVAARYESFYAEILATRRRGRR